MWVLYSLVLHNYVIFQSKVTIEVSSGFTSSCLCNLGKLYNVHFRNEETEVLKWTLKKKKTTWDFPGGLAVKNLSANAGDMGSIPGLGRSHIPQGN